MAAMDSLLVGEIIRRNAAVVPNQPAASMEGRLLSHGALEHQANRVAARLRREGVRVGDRIVSWADTSLPLLALFAAAAKLGAVFAPLNARYGTQEAAAVARLARPTLWVADGPRQSDAGKLAPELGVPLLGLEGLVDRAAAEGAGPATAPPPELRETDPQTMFFTSGSTGPPKGVLLSHRANYLRSFQGVFRDEPERSVCMFPLFHMGGFTLALSAWQTRGELALVPAATADALLHAVAERHANRLYCIPAVWARILATAPDAHDTSSLRQVDTGTSATPIELVRALKARFPEAALRIYYGSTEVGSAAALSDADVLRKPGSVGLPPPGVDLRLAPDGEICVRSAYLMDGYFDDPAATAAALRDGWFHTGDLGAQDAEGYLSVVGRKKEIIRTGGESVTPLEVEAVLAEHPAVAEVAVVGIPDPEWGEIVCAAVVLAAGASLDLDELQVHCEGRLAGFKKPRRLERVSSLPRTAATGQVQRSLLVEQITNPLTSADG